MSYQVQLHKAAKWLVSIRNKDKGWGLSEGQASSIVNTAEAIYVLTKASPTDYHLAITEGLDFIQSKTIDSANKMPRTRYVFFALLACLEHLEKVNSNFIQDCKQWLLKARNNDGAWGHTANDENSKLYPTVMALLMLDLFCSEDELATAYNWIKSKSIDGNGWRFSGDVHYSPIATALAVIALRKVTDSDDHIFVWPKEQLLTVSTWDVETEDMPGTPWVHCSYMWIFPSLTQLGVEPYSKTIAQGVRELNKLNCDNGWKEPNRHLTVRGQFWATFALHNLKQAYDPAIHTYRI
ncbi:MAG: terpene cyclase/mutase family protein, partial [Candidatus Subteraquimicrobiales bacterium]|nr:terpene cyclase/mutase family protein [Candidatus Subteraquimicrobiales bacterium]